MYTYRGSDNEGGGSTLCPLSCRETPQSMSSSITLAPLSDVDSAADRETAPAGSTPASKKSVEGFFQLPPVISIVIPAHNEQHNVEPLIKEILDVRGKLPAAEIIYVDDGSTDQTLEELRRVRHEYMPDLRILSNQSSVGQSTAILTGVRSAKGRLIVTLDADGQNPPSDIPAMVAVALAQHPNSHFCIAGYRHQRQDTRWKKFQSRIANAVRRAILRDGTPDTGCALKIIPRETWLQLPGFDHMHRFLPALIQRIGGTVVVQKVSHRHRLYDESKYAMRDRVGAGIIDLVGMLWLGRRTRITQITEVTGEQDLS